MDNSQLGEVELIKAVHGHDVVFQLFAI